MESLLTVFTFERPHAVVKQHVTLQRDLLPESLPALVDRAGELEGEVFCRVRLLLVLHQVFDHLETATALFAPERTIFYSSLTTIFKNKGIYWPLFLFIFVLFSIR